MSSNMMAKVKAPAPGVFIMRGSGIDNVVLIPPEAAEETQEQNVRHHPDQSTSGLRSFKVLGDPSK